MKKHLSRLSHFGFSIAEFSVALAVGSLVALGGAYVLTTSTQTQVTISAQNELNNEHLLALQKVRNKQEILSRLGLNTPQAQACFGRSSTSSCASLAVTSAESNNEQINSYFAAGSATFVNTVQYRVNCSAQRCTHLEFTIQTELDPTYSSQRKMVASRRLSQVNIPGSILFSRAEYDFSCLNGPNKLLERIDHETLRATCKAMQVPMDCTVPLAGFGSATATCQSMENQTCGGMGFSRLGVFASQSSCNPGGTSAATPPLPPSPTTTAAPPPTTTVPPATTTTVACPVGTGLAGLGGPHSSRPECKCSSAGTVWDTGSSSCATPSTCAPNYSATSLGSAGFSIPGSTPPLTCFCPSSFSNTGIGVSHGTFGGCKCPTADHFINGSGSCVTCPSTAKPTSSSPAPLGQTLPAPNNECRCPGADEYYSSGLGCTSCGTAYPGSVLAGTGSGAAVAPSGGSCVCRNSGETWNTLTRKCCLNGALSGSAAFASCTPNQPQSCLFNGQTIAHGQTITAFQSPTVSSGQTCVSEPRTCVNGNLSGSFTAPSCVVQAPQCQLLHPIGWDGEIAQGSFASCAEYFRAPGSSEPVQVTRHNVGEVMTFYARYCPFGSCNGQIVYRCELINGVPTAVVQTDQTFCRSGFAL